MTVRPYTQLVGFVFMFSPFPQTAQVRHCRATLGLSADSEEFVNCKLIVVRNNLFDLFKILQHGYSLRAE